MIRYGIGGYLYFARLVLARGLGLIQTLLSEDDPKSI